jgi:hypothetical protein
MVIERRDGSLWMLTRSRGGFLEEAFSNDKGFSWSSGRQSSIESPGSRFHIRRLKSGNLLLINHYRFMASKPGLLMSRRNNLTALLSQDDGVTWENFLLLDEREGSSYPDACEGSDGRIYIVYDRERTKAKEILLADITEADILAGRCVSAGSTLKNVAVKAYGVPVDDSVGFEIRRFYGLFK